MNKRTGSVLGVLICFIWCRPAIPQYEKSPFVPDGYELVFIDEFEDDVYLDVEGDGSEHSAPWMVGWNVRYLNGNSDKCFKCDESFTGNGNESLDVVLHETTGDGTLKLYGKQTPEDKLAIVDQLPYIGGMISGQKNFSQQYGYFDIRCRFEVSKGVHWAMWLLPTNNAWPPEIDIVEVVGHQPDLIHMTAHWDDGSGHKSNYQFFSGVQTDEFHNYAFEWTEDHMIWYLDGIEKKRMENFVDQPMYFLLSPEVGGNWTGLPDQSSAWPTVCEVDYIRFYESTDASVKNAHYTEDRPETMSLLQNYPNPFNPDTQIEYYLNRASEVDVSIYNIEGQWINSLVQSAKQAGRYTVRWSGLDVSGNQVPSGVYICSLKTGRSTIYRQMLLLK